jgi:hypothetical protein
MQRRLYNVRKQNHLWQIDSNLKLISWKFVLHRAVAKRLNHGQGGGTVFADNMSTTIINNFLNLPKMFFERGWGRTRILYIFPDFIF